MRFFGSGFPVVGQAQDLPLLMIIVDLRINETLQTGAVRKPHLPFCRLVAAVSNCAYSVRLETAPTERRKYLFIFRIHQLLNLLYNGKFDLAWLQRRAAADT